MATPDRGRHPDITITPLHPDEIGTAVAVLARGMRDNPLHVAAFGEDSKVREEGLLRLFTAATSVFGWDRQMLVARDSNRAIVGVCALSLPGTCQATAWQRLRMAPTLIRLGPGPAGRVLRWLGAWAKRDPHEPHWHLGPIAVDAGLQGQGIGSRLMESYCALADAAAASTWLETDKETNVGFYHRFGFETVANGLVLGTRCWYMMRRPRR